MKKILISLIIIITISAMPNYATAELDVWIEDFSNGTTGMVVMGGYNIVNDSSYTGNHKMTFTSHDENKIFWNLDNIPLENIVRFEIHGYINFSTVDNYALKGLIIDDENTTYNLARVNSDIRATWGSASGYFGGGGYTYIFSLGAETRKVEIALDISEETGSLKVDERDPGTETMVNPPEEINLVGYRNRYPDSTVTIDYVKAIGEIVEGIANLQKEIKGYTDIKLTWEVTGDSDKVNIYIDDVLIGDTTLNEYQITGLEPGTEYKITLENIFNNSSTDQVEANYSTLEFPDVSNLQQVTSTYDAITVGWTGASESDHYNVYVNGSLYTTTTSLEQTITGLDPETNYIIKVTNEYLGHESPGVSSSYETAQIPDISNLQLESNTYNSITVEWSDASESDHYNVYVNGDIYTTTIITQQTITGLAPETNYIIKVTNSLLGHETPGLSNTFGTTGSSIIVTGVHVEEKTEVTVTIGWNEYQNADSYKIYVDGVLNGFSDNTEYKIDSLQPGTYYSVAVAAVIDTWESDLSIPVTVSTDIFVEANNPVNIYKSDSGTYYIELTWDFDPHNDGYDIYMLDYLWETVTGNVAKIEGLEHDGNYTIGVQGWKNHQGQTLFSDIVYGTYETKSIPPGATYIYIDQLKMYSAVIGWDSVPEADQYRIYVDDKLHSTYNPGTYQTELELRPGREYKIHATLISEATPESEPSNVLYIELPMPIHETETNEMLARVTDIGRGIAPAILIIMALVIATKVTQIGLKYLAKV